MFEIIHKHDKNSKNFVYIVQSKSDLKDIQQCDKKSVLYEKMLDTLEGKKSQKFEIFI